MNKFDDFYTSNVHYKKSNNDIMNILKCNQEK